MFGRKMNRLPFTTAVPLWQALCIREVESMKRLCTEYMKIGAIAMKSKSPLLAIAWPIWCNPRLTSKRPHFPSLCKRAERVPSPSTLFVANALEMSLGAEGTRMLLGRLTPSKAQGKWTPTGWRPPLGEAFKDDNCEGGTGVLRHESLFWLVAKELEIKLLGRLLGEGTFWIHSKRTSTKGFFWGVAHVACHRELSFVNNNSFPWNFQTSKILAVFLAVVIPKTS